MGIRSGMLVLWLCACGVTTGDPPLDDGGAAGGGGGGGDLGINRSGTRIKTRMLTSPDGAKVFQSMHDTQRGEDCTFEVASDGIIRCLPNSRAYGFSYFTDPLCTVPGAPVIAGCTPPAYIVIPDTSLSTCAPGPRLFARGTMHPSHYLKSGVGGACVGPTTIPGYVFYSVSGSEVPPSSFQMATSAIE